MLFVQTSEIFTFCNLLQKSVLLLSLDNNQGSRYIFLPQRFSICLTANHVFWICITITASVRQV